CYAEARIETQVERQNRHVLAPATRRIVAAPHADLLEAVGGIQAPSPLVRRPDFEEQDFRLVLARDSDPVREQAASMAPALRTGGDAQVEEMGLASGMHEHRVTDELSAVAIGPAAVSGAHRVAEIPGRPGKFI